jgi:hypothetical protein
MNREAFSSFGLEARQMLGKSKYSVFDEKRIFLELGMILWNFSRPDLLRRCFQNYEWDSFKAMIEGILPLREGISVNQ